MTGGGWRSKKGLCRVASIAAAALCAWVALAACVDPSDQYDDYLNRTSAIRGSIAVQSDSGPVEASLPDGGFTLTYVVTCYPSFTSLANVLRFQDEVTFTPAASGPGGTLTATLEPIAKGSATAANTVMPFIGPFSTPVDANGNFQFDLKNVVIPAAANPISPADAQFDTDTYLPGIFESQSMFCGGLSGDLVMPIEINFCPATNVCLFVQMDPSSPLPTYQKSDFTCPGLPVPSGC